MDTNVCLEVARLEELTHAGRERTVEWHGLPTRAMGLDVAIIQLDAVLLDESHHPFLEHVSDVAVSDAAGLYVLVIQSYFIF